MKLTFRAEKNRLDYYCRSDTEQRTLSGAAIGTAAGGIVWAIAGNTGVGLAVGAVAGRAGGFLDRNQKTDDRR